MTQEKFKEIEKVWNRMDDTKRWKFLMENQHLGLEVQMDNDDTFVTHPNLDEDENYDSYSLQFDNFIGWADGLHALFKAIGIKGDCV